MIIKFVVKNIYYDSFPLGSLDSIFYDKIENYKFHNYLDKYHWFFVYDYHYILLINIMDIGIDISISHIYIKLFNLIVSGVINITVLNDAYYNNSGILPVVF